MRCDNCPVDPGKVCHGTHEQLSYFCDWAKSGDMARLRAIVGRAEFPPPEPATLRPCQDCDKPAPGPIAMAAGFLASAATVVASGLAGATAEEKERRLMICLTCSDNVGGRCQLCGCPVASKVVWSEIHCDADKW